ncbi:unnamed protein product [Clonostachys byssicola]|uniref:Uncharacterized protein n=1 Tax=Clonostachys byssicola TaxID=160290 RepID=A0A9N9YA04_9HYPO|nr:unnamed protein product [Clonostachys byssicola]
MAQGHVPIAYPSASDAAAAATDKRIHDIQQYKKIVQFGDAVLSGSHPSVKLPPGLLALSRPSPRPINGSLQANGQKPAAQAWQKQSTAQASPDALSVKRAPAPARTEINPILLEKSDELIKAELQLKRQRLERSLREEIDRRRGSKHDKAEPMADVDLSNILSKALTLVQETAGPSHLDENLSATNEPASDSFDDNTFYSSRHDTPESQLIHRVSDESPAAQASTTDHADPQPQKPITGYSLVGAIDGTATSVPAIRERPALATSAPVGFHVPGLNNYPSEPVTSARASHNNTSGEQSLSGDSGNTSEPQRDQYQGFAGHSSSQAYADAHPPSPLIRAYNVLPVPPRPAQLSQAAVEGPLITTPSQPSNNPRGAPAQVAALRSEPFVNTSPDSSPQTGKNLEKKKSKKKKKRKADRQPPEDVMPYIKPEPQSPSPIQAPTFTRPSKRQKQSQRQGNEPDHDELTIIHDPQQQHEQQPLREEAVAARYDIADYPQQPAGTRVITERQYGKDYSEDRGTPRDVYLQRQPSPSLYIQRPLSAAYSTRPIVIDNGYGEPLHRYPPYEVPRMSARPDVDTYGQHRPPPTRIIVDSFGREYIEPPRPPVRQSVAPTIGHGEPEILYERAPPRAVSRHLGPLTYEEPGIVYPRATSAYPYPRRVVTQPERILHDYGDGRPREYSLCRRRSDEYRMTGEENMLPEQQVYGRQNL